MNETDRLKTPVELYGGALDGHRALLDHAELVGKDVHLFRREEGGCREVFAYELAGRAAHKGRLWVLKFKLRVSWMRLDAGGQAS